MGRFVKRTGGDAEVKPVGSRFRVQSSGLFWFFGSNPNLEPGTLNLEP
jgi:hypothetical protein